MIAGVLYPLIAEVSGASVIIDSSKHPAWAYLLAGTETVDALDPNLKNFFGRGGKLIQ